MLRFFISIVMVVGFGILTPQASHAAQIFFGVHTTEVSVGKQAEFGVFIAAQGEVLNAVEGDVVIPADMLEVSSVYDGNSIISYWVERPTIKNGFIHFSGIIPGGYGGNDGLLFSVISKPKKEGTVTVFSQNESVLKNDGEGSSAAVTRSPLVWNINSTPTALEAQLPIDTGAPEPFVAYRGQDQNVFDGAWYVGFGTQDKGSGVKSYEVREGIGFYHTAESPYRLRNQKVDSRIQVRAIDNAGNIQTSILPPLFNRAWYRRYDVSGIIIGVIVLSFATWAILRSKYLRKRR